MASKPFVEARQIRAIGLPASVVAVVAAWDIDSDDFVLGLHLTTDEILMFKLSEEQKAALRKAQNHGS